jgi:cytidylate kinase
VNINDVQAVEKALENVHIQFLFDAEKGNRTILNNKDVENELGTMRVANFVSYVSAVSAVRCEMVRQQQQIGRQKGVVLEGRDIGTVVFPDAELKLFVTSEVQIRVQRRLREFLEKGQNVDFETIKANLLERDFIDTTRGDSPLKKADDAIVLDNSYLNRAEQLEVALQWAKKRCLEK